MEELRENIDDTVGIRKSRRSGGKIVLQLEEDQKGNELIIMQGIYGVLV